MYIHKYKIAIQCKSFIRFTSMHERPAHRCALYECLPLNIYMLITYHHRGSNLAWFNGFQDRHAVFVSVSRQEFHCFRSVTLKKAVRFGSFSSLKRFTHKYISRETEVKRQDTLQIFDLFLR